MFLQSALLKSVFVHEFLFVVLHDVIVVIRMTQDTLEKVDVEMV